MQIPKRMAAICAQCGINFERPLAYFRPSRKNAGKYCSKDCRIKSTIGRIPWNKNKPMSNETRQKVSLAKSGSNHQNYGKHLSQATRSKISLHNKGKHLDRTGRTYLEIYGDRAQEIIRKIKEGNAKKVIPPETRQKIRASLTGRHHTPEWFIKMRGRKLTAEHIKKSMRRRIPTSLEEKFLAITQKYNLPYCYVGDGSLMIDKYNPDFIRTDGQKTLVEVYARMYKTIGNRSIDNWKQERNRVFSQHGYKTYFFDETELNEANVLTALS